MVKGTKPRKVRKALLLAGIAFILAAYGLVLAQEAADSTAAINTTANISLNQKVNKSGDNITGVININNPHLMSAFVNINSSGLGVVVNRNSSDGAYYTALGIANYNETNKNAVVFGILSLFNGVPSQGASIGAVFNDHTDVTKTDLTLNVAALPKAKINNSNFSIVNSGNGFILKSKDGTRCGFIYWGNDDTLKSNSITCP